jgi:hypothetical protein|tara:strand:- start:257 stop:646 length:390 start_codon:yes stop_codon:yes gene_type:complete
MLKELVEISYQNGFFDEVTEDVLNDEEQFNALVDAFVKEVVNRVGIVNELRKKRVIRGKKLKLRVICPRNKRYVPSKKQCVRVSGQQRMLKKRAMRKAAIKKRGKKAMILRKRIKSMRKRKAMGLRRGR